MEHGLDARSFEAPRGLRFLRILGVAIIGICLAALFALLFGWLVMLLWNWLMPSLFGIKTVTYWQAFGITILAKILFSGFHGDHGKNRHADHIHRKVDSRWHRWMGIKDDEPPGEVIGRFSHEEMKHYREFWKTKGEAAFAEFLKNRGPAAPSPDKGA
ncbi:MAG: hypothetical protein JXA71_14330 [Chitinispirillaceae bacterium]|nr:hypothetical protein [Chitinispirillaceae bacterium]